MLDPTAYRDAFHRDTSLIAAAARRGLSTSLPSCPGWSVATLVTHLAGIYAHRTRLVERRAEENPVRQYEDVGLPLELKEWFESDATDLSMMPAGLVELFEQQAAGLEQVLWSVGPQEPVWTWWEADQTAGFWQRRMAQETAVHLWDIQLAHGTEQPIEGEMASDGIDETLEVMLPARRGWAENPRAGSGETYHFHRTDGPGEWLVRLDPEGPTVTREHAKGDVAVRGSDLMLFLWQRIRAERLEVFGDASLLARYFELVPPD